VVFVRLHHVFASELHPEAVNVIGTLEEMGVGYAPTPCPIKFESPLCAVELSLTVGLF
jgi:hypothetical protein